MNLFILTSLSGLLVTGCGFHLRGQIVMPPGVEAAYLECPFAKNLSLCTVISKRFRQSGLLLSNAYADSAVTEHADDASRVYKVVVGNIAESQRVVSVTDEAKAAEYEVTLKLDLTIINPRGEILTSKTRMRKVQAFRYDETSVLGKEKEARQIRKDLEQGISQNIISRFAAAVRSDSAGASDKSKYPSI